MKKENSKTKYIVIAALIAILAVGWFVVPCGEKAPQRVVQQKAAVPVVAPAVARIDLSAPYTEEAQFVVYAEDGQPLDEAEGMPKYNARGYRVQKNGNDTTFKIITNEDVVIKLSLRGKWEKDKAGNRIPRWVRYTSVKINGEEILDEPKSVWHDKPFVYQLLAEKGDTYEVVAKWQKTDGEK